MASRKNLDSAAMQATAKLFSNADEKKENPEVEVDSEKRDGEISSSSENTKKTLTVFSFRGPSELVDKWRLYGAMVKIQNVNSGNKKYKVDDLWTDAIEEYISNHPLEGPALEIIRKK